MTSSPDKISLLKQYFGHNSFRPKQEETIDAILAGSDVLMVLPTGGGKSLTYQLPTLMMEGVTIVISPLIALMQDQVRSLQAQQHSAAMLSSTQSSEENAEVIKQLTQGALKFLYLSPERLNTPSMQNTLLHCHINFFVIDEAHCISQWGHEFREDYRALPLIKEFFPTINVAAFTATATETVQSDIITQLRLNNPLLIKGKIFRDNLHISVQQRIKNGYAQVEAFIKNRAEQNGIVYASSRKKCEELSAYLNTRGFNALYYHAGMEKEARDEVFQAFVYDRVNIIVATIAFGMGIDKSNIRFVMHLSMPKTLEGYYQEIGRAGRDGEEAEVVMLYAAEDAVYARMQIDEVPNETYRRHLHEKLNTVFRYVTSQSCRHQQLARYFEDEMEPCMTLCDNCLRGEVEESDITEEAQKFLSCIYRTQQRFGKNYIIDVLRGSKDKKITQNGHDTLSVYGIGKERSKKEWFVICDRLLECGSVTLGEYHVLLLTQEGLKTLKGENRLSIATERLDVKSKLSKIVVHEEVDYDEALYQKLRTLRADIAQDRGVPAYIVFGDKTLKEMARHKPTTKEEMLAINGVGEKKFDQYGFSFLEAIS